MPGPASTLTPIRFAGCWILAGALEASFLWHLESALWVALACHVVASALIFISVSREGEAGRWQWNFLFLTLSLPVAGWGMLPLLFFGGVSKSASLDLDEDQTLLVGPSMLQNLRAPTQSRRTRILRALDFMPLADILASDDIDLKRGAVDKLAQLKTPEAVTLLLQHRSDSSTEMRFYVTSALARIKKEYDEELEAAKKELAKAKDAARARLLLARIYLQYAASGLLDDATVQAHRREALYHLGAISKMPDVDRLLKGEAGQMQLWLHISNQSWEEGLSTIDRLAAEDLVDPQELTRARVQILYRSGRFPEVKQAMTQLAQSGIQDKDWSAVANWWGVA